MGKRASSAIDRDRHHFAGSLSGLHSRPAVVAVIGMVGWGLGIASFALLNGGAPAGSSAGIVVAAGTVLVSASTFFVMALREFAPNKRVSPIPKNNLDELTESVSLLARALDNMAQGLVMFDAQERIVFCNEFYIEMYELSREVAKPGCLLIDLLRHRVETGGLLNKSPEQYRRELIADLARGQVVSLVVETPRRREVLVKNSPMLSGGWVATHEDITDRRRAEAQITYMACHDALTGLLNRSRFQEELQRTLVRRLDGQFAVLCLDLDRFKEVNDTLGHSIGDLLIKAVAGRLRKCVRETDLVARLGGDEFAILQFGASQPSEVTQLASRLLDANAAPYEVGGHQVLVGLSIGIALAPDDGRDVESLLKSADLALYRAKIDGRSVYRLFEPEMHTRMQARRSLEADLRRALTEGQFKLFYQPIVNVKTQRLTAFEALVRWQHPARGLLAPVDFIAVAEETGLAIPLGEWILLRACVQAIEWPADVRLVVNLSPVHFRSKGFIAAVRSALDASGLAPSRMELDITESIILRNCDATLLVLQQLRDLGVRIAMDDFGTGHSLLSYLRKFPFDKIKIDASFIRDMSHYCDSLAIVRAIVAMGSDLRIGVIAEGVETPQQLERLRAEGCTEAQGYLFSPPAPAADLSAWLANAKSTSLKEIRR
jgi:diguanylate cyclase (GGDEF)-like protein